MSEHLDLLDYYTLLGIEQSASPRDIKDAFRRFARKYHPDRFAGAPEDKVARASQIYRRGSEAYQILTDPIARRAYDRALNVGKLRLSADERERAEAEERGSAGRAPANKPPPIRSPQAVAFYNKAADAARSGRWRDAWRAMKSAIEEEPENSLLKARLAQIEAKLRTER
jgi:curved DNA-binding protein CbpA